MRTKILLTAAAAMVAGIVSSNAQVYSANIVGYVNYVSKTNTPGYELICNPLDNGSNTIKNIFPTAPGGSAILVWTGSGYNTATYSTLLGGHWKTNGVTADNMLLNPGSGFFIQIASGVYSNTFVGNVPVQTGVVSNMTFASGYQMLGSLVPYGDYVTNTSTVNITNVAGGTAILEWNVASGGYNTYTWSTLLGGHWKLNGVNSTPFLNVGQGFFFNSPSNYTWQITGP
jgi:hypothetical protein